MTKTAKYRGAQFGTTDSSRMYYYQKDVFGNVKLIRNMNGDSVRGYYYDAYGNNFLSAGGNDYFASINPITYRCYYEDNYFGGYYNLSRYYNPYFGRFFNLDDPAIALQSKSDPDGMNLFAYCNNDPVNYTDPTGYLSKIDAAIWLITITIIVYYVAPDLLNDKKGKYSFEASKVVLDKTGLCLAKIKYYKSKWNKKSFQIVIGGKSDWGNKIN